MKYLLFIALGFFPVLSFAATYNYVDTQGEIRSVEAPDAQTAIEIAPDIVLHSGVAIDTGLLDPGEEVSAFPYAGSDTYHYVNVAGVTDTVQAPSAQAALSIAPNIALHSGVAIDQGEIESGMVIESVAD